MLPWPLHASTAFPLDGSLGPAHVQILSVACGVWVVEQAGHTDSLEPSVLGKAGASGGHVNNTFANIQIHARKSCNCLDMSSPPVPRSCDCGLLRRDCALWNDLQMCCRHCTHWFVMTETRSGDLMSRLPLLLCV